MKDPYQQFTEYQCKQPLMIEGDLGFFSSPILRKLFSKRCENGKKHIQALQQFIKQKAKQKSCKGDSEPKHPKKDVVQAGH